MTRRQILAIFGLLLFVAGTLVVPALHRLELSHRAEACAHSICCCDGYHHHHEHEEVDPPQSGEHRSGKEPDTPKPHNPHTCPICQLAQMPVDTSVTALVIPHMECIAPVIPGDPESPVLKTVRTLPFSRGPPA